MQSDPSRTKRWLAGTAGVLAVAIGLAILGIGAKPPNAVTSLPVTDSRPNTAASSLASASLTARDSPSETGAAPTGNFAAAMKAALQNGEDLNDDRGAFELGYRWVAVEPEAALAFVLNLPFDHTLLLVALVDEWARRDPVSASTWAARLPEGPQRQRVLPSLVAAWSETAPADAARFASNLPPGDVKNEAIVAATSGWAQQDPRAVLTWAQQFLQGTQQEQIYTQAVFAWSRHDPVAAAGWLRSMPEGKAWDVSTSALSGALVERYPALALSLAENISDENLRHQRIENIARRWLEADRAAAEHALIHSDLPTAWVSRWLR